jgi:hypothetical protein
MDPVGAHQFWGFSPALDLQQVSRTVMGASWPPPSSSSPASPSSTTTTTTTTTDAGAASAAPAPPASVGAAAAQDNTLRILLLMPGDIRHVVKSIAQRYRHSSRPLHVRSSEGGPRAEFPPSHPSLTPPCPPSPPPQFYVYDKPTECLARHLLLLSVACDWELPVRQRAVAFLEIFGNLQLTQRLARHVSARSVPALIDLLCNQGGPPPLGQVVDFEGLRFKARDELETLLHALEEGVAFDAAALHDHRLRHNYGARYDFRTNLVDWDYQSVLKKNSGVVAWPLYKDWRNTGRAFEFGDSTYDAPNRSLASYVDGRERGLSTQRRGYWGDTVVSPFHAVGTACYVPTDEEAKAAALALAVSGGAAAGGEAPAAPAAAAAATATGNHAHGLFEVMSRHTGTEQWRHHAAEIAAYNVVSWLHEIETGRQYVLRAPHDVYSGLSDAAPAPATAAPAAATTTAPESAAAAAPGAGATPSPSPSPTTPLPLPAADPAAMSPEEHAALQARMRATVASRARTIARAFKNVRITLLTGDFAADVLEKGKLAGTFHVVTASSRSTHLLNHARFPGLFSPDGGVLVAETVRNVPSLKAEQRDDFARRVLGIAGAGGCALVGTDRVLSADTFAIGSVIDASTKQAAAGKTAPAAADAGAVASSVSPFECSADGLFPGLPASAATAAVGELGPKKEGAARPALRVKRVGMAAYSHNPSPLPAVADLRAAAAGASAGGGAAATSDAPSLQAAGAAAASHLRAAMRGVAAHDIRGGDNPFPEAFVFAYVPGAAPTIAAAIAAVGGAKKEEGEGVVGGAAGGAAGSGAAGSNAGAGAPT